MVPARLTPDRPQAPAPQFQPHWAVYLFAAVCPERDEASGLVLPLGPAGAMQVFLEPASEQGAPAARALLLMDRAGWHCANDLVMPENLKPICLPPYSPQPNASKGQQAFDPNHATDAVDGVDNNGRK